MDRLCNAVGVIVVYTIAFVLSAAAFLTVMLAVLTPALAIYVGPQQFYANIANGRPLMFSIFMLVGGIFAVIGFVRTIVFPRIK